MMSSYLSGHIVPLTPSTRPTNVEHLVKQRDEQVELMSRKEGKLVLKTSYFLIVNCTKISHLEVFITISFFFIIYCNFMSKLLFSRSPKKWIMWWQFPTENHIVPSPKLMALKFPNFRTSTFITQMKKVKIIQVKRNSNSIYVFAQR